MYERSFPFIAALLNHKALGHSNTLFTTAGFLLPSPRQEKTHGYIIIMIGIIPCCMHHSVQHAVLSSPAGRIHLVSINSISFIDSFFSLVHCLYWKGSLETCFSTEPNIFSLLFLNALKWSGNLLSLWSPARHWISFCCFLDGKKEDNPTFVATQRELRCVKIVGRMEGGSAQLRHLFSQPLPLQKEEY